MFIRLFRPKEDKEILINVDMIRKIEVEYGAVVPDDKWAYSTSLEHAATDPNTMRFYRIFVGNDEFFLAGNAGDRVVSVIEEIYKNAIKGEMPPAPPDEPQ